MTYGPVTGDTGSPQPPPARVGLLIGLVAVLLVICGGIAFTGYRFVGTDTGDRAAAEGPRWDPPVRTPDPGLPTPAPSTRDAPGSPSAPATLAPEPFGTSHPAVWPDGLRAMVLGVQLVDLPASAGDDYPPGLYIGVVIRLEIDNGTPAALTITHAEEQLYYYGVQAAPFVDPGGHYVLSGTVRSGSKLVGAVAFGVPRDLVSNLEFELRPRPGDAPARFVGSAG